jgi:hypothetical protein
MASGGKVDWYADDVVLVVEDATDELVSELAFYVEGEAKTGAPVDTGFMRNAIYALTPQGSRRARAAAEATSAAERDLAPAPGLDEHEAAVHGAAEYTIYQEERVGFLYRALERARGVAGGLIESVGRQYFG